jgi:queuine tRNA-ribosyltransferase
MIHHTVTHETAAAHGNFHYHLYVLPVVETVLAITLHNIVFQAQVMGRARESIIAGTFPEYLRSFFAEYFGGAAYPEWCVNALRSVGVDLLKDNLNIKVTPGNGAKWDVSSI